MTAILVLLTALITSSYAFAARVLTGWVSHVPSEPAGVFNGKFCSGAVWQKTHINSPAANLSPALLTAAAIVTIQFVLSVKAGSQPYMIRPAESPSKDHPYPSLNCGPGSDVVIATDSGKLSAGVFCIHQVRKSAFFAIGSTANRLLHSENAYWEYMNKSGFYGVKNLNSGRDKR